MRVASHEQRTADPSLDLVYAETGILTLATVPPLGSVARSKLQASP